MSGDFHTFLTDPENFQTRFEIGKSFQIIDRLFSNRYYMQKMFQDIANKRLVRWKNSTGGAGYKA